MVIMSVTLLVMLTCGVVKQWITQRECVVAGQEETQVSQRQQQDELDKMKNVYNNQLDILIKSFKNK